MVRRLLVSLRQHRVDDLADELLLCLRQSAELFELLLQFRRRPALGQFADEFFDSGSQNSCSWLKSAACGEKTMGSENICVSIT